VSSPWAQRTSDKQGTQTVVARSIASTGVGRPLLSSLVTEALAQPSSAPALAACHSTADFKSRLLSLSLSGRR